MERLRKILEYYDRDFANSYYVGKFPDEYYDHDEDEDLGEYSQNSDLSVQEQYWVGIPTSILAVYFILKFAFLIATGNESNY